MIKIKSIIKKIRKTRKIVIISSLIIIIILAPLVAYSLLNTTENTVKADCFFKFDEGYGTTVSNTVASTVTGTITGAVWRTEDLCLSGKCLFFDGSGDYISFGDENIYDFTAEDNFTISVWIRHVPKNSGIDVIIAKTNASAGYKLYMEFDGDITFAIDDDSSWTPDASVSSTAAIYDDNRWHHIAAIKTGTTKIELYIDGLLVGTNASISSVSDLTNSANFYVGIDGNGSSNPFTGFIDELKIYTTSARTADEIKTDVLGVTTSQGTAVAFSPDQSYLSDGLVGYWDFNNGSVDRSGNSNGFLNTGATTVAGKFDSAKEYIPASSHFQYASSPNMDNAQTVSFWVNPDSTTTPLYTLNSATVQATSGNISTTGFTNPKIYVNGQPSTSLTADTWQHVTVTANPLYDAGHTPLPNNNGCTHLASSTYCISEDDCKVAYVNGDDTSLHFMDCDDASCSSGTISILDGGIGCLLTGGDGCDSSISVIQDQHLTISLYCPSADDCKISYYDNTNSALRFADCNDATCSSGSVEILDGYTGCGLTGGDICDTSIGVGSYSSLVCPSATDCKISYYDTTNTALMFADCDDATCSSGSVEILDGFTGCGLTGGDACDESIAAGRVPSLFCSSATDCKVVYNDETNTAVMFADCADATCSSGSVEIIDGYTGCGLTGGDVCDESSTFTRTIYSISCPSADNCKMAYTDSNRDLYLADCADATCSSGSVELVDGATGCGLTGCGNNVTYHASLSCSTSTDCKIAYSDDGFYNDVFFADCDNEACSTGSVVRLDFDPNCVLTGGDGCTKKSNGSSGGRISLFCPTADNCKFSFNKPSYRSLVFGDCDNAACSSGSLETIDGGDTEADPIFDIYCVSQDNCKMAYFNDSDRTLRFLDCDDATCSSGRETILDGAGNCTLKSGDGCTTERTPGNNDLSLYCPTADDCKISYGDNGMSALLFADCDDEFCSSGSVEILDGYPGCSLTGGDGCTPTSMNAGHYSSLFCPATDDCKITYYDSTNTAVRFADCANATCSSGSVEIIDGAASCGLTGGDVCDESISASPQSHSLYCPATDDCKIAYYDATNTALMFADCADATCSSGSVEILDGYTGCGLTGGDVCEESIDAGNSSPALYCPSATDCKITYYDATNRALMFADCADTTCSSGSVEILDGYTGCGLNGGDGCSTTIEAGLDSSLICLSATDCKITYSDRGGNTNLKFADCDDATCSSGSVDMLDGGTNCSLTGGDGCNTAIDAGGYDISMSCPSGDDCKIAYLYYSNYSDQPLMFADCDSATCSSGSVEIASSGLSTIFQLGRAGSNYFDGTIDEVRLYNRTLSPAEVQDLYEWAPGPVGYWKLDEGSGTTAYDSSGNGNNLSDTSSTTIVNGKYGKAKDFDYTKPNYLSITDTAQTNLSITGPISFSTWVTLGIINPPYGPTIVSKTGADGNYGYRFNIEQDGLSQGRVRITVSPDGSTANVVSLIGDTQITENSDWHHVAATYDGSYLRVYLDGVLDGQTSYSGGIYNSSGDFYLGSSYGSSGTQYEYDGLIDDVKIYNYARTQEQIIQDMNAGHPAPGSPVGSPILHWKFNEGSENTCSGGVNDVCNSGSQGSTLDAANSGATRTNSGKFGKGLTIDTISDTVSAGDVSFVDVLAQMTVSLWMNPSELGQDDRIIGKLPFNTFSNSFLLRTPNGITDEIEFCIASSLTDNCGNRFDTSNFDLTTSSWVHITAVYDGTKPASDRIKIYKNATEVPGSITGTIPTSMTSGSTSSLILGDVTANNQTMLATYDEVKIYNFALTADQVKTEYNQGAATIFGSLSTDSSGTVAAFDAARAYCVPGDTSTCNPPVAEWKLDENIGGYAYDTSGNGNTGTLTNGPEWVTGKSGSALSFDGADDYVDANSGSTIDDIFDGGGTIEAWVYPSINSASFDDIISKRVNGWGWLAEFNSLSGNTAQVLFQHDFDSGNDGIWRTGFDIYFGQWNHLAITYDNSSTTNDPIIYINGILKSLTEAGTPVGNARTDASEYFRIGQYDDDGTTDSFDGLIDQVRLYNYARTPAQIAWDYNRGGPVGWWKMNENQAGDGLTVYDSSENENDGTTEGGTGDLDCTVDGKQGKACDFDGSDDYIFMNLVPTSNITDVSLSAWVKWAGNTGLNQVIFNTGVDASCTGWTLRLASSDNNELQILTSCAGTATSNTALVQDVWTHVVAVRKIDGTWKIFVNGEQIDMASTTGYGGTASTVQTAIGAFYNNGPYTGKFKGLIDDVRIYNYALTDKQIQLLYTGGAVKF